MRPGGEHARAAWDFVSLDNIRDEIDGELGMAKAGLEKAARDVQTARVHNIYAALTAELSRRETNSRKQVQSRRTELNEVRAREAGLSNALNVEVETLGYIHEAQALLPGND